MSRKFTVYVKSLFSQHGQQLAATGYGGSEVPHNDSAPVDPDAPAEFISDDPEVSLSGVIKPNRNKEQNKRIDAILGNPNYRAPHLDHDDLIFDPSPEWAYTILQVARPEQGSTSRGSNPLGNRPPQPKKNKSAAAIAEAGLPTQQSPDPVGKISTPELRADLVLFNVLVALEWTPTDDYLRGLEWAFRRASDYLYDVTDGKMAFGQVIFGGAEWMACADIQIMASNRFHPRSWVNGLHMQEKYLPIRLGRGYWFHSSRVTIPWDEPEAYRVLVHEWAHYALNQKDAYLQPIDLQRVSDIARATEDARLKALPDYVLLPKQDTTAPIYKAVVQRVRESSDSIMATTLGTSELVPHAGGCQEQRKKNEWGKIHQIDGFKNLIQPNPPLEGPGRLPLPLPQFVQLTPKKAPEAPLFPALKPPPMLEAQRLRGMPSTPEDKRPRDIPPHQSWLYVIRNLATGQPSLIAQGTLDAHATDDGFKLLGATAGDTVVLVAKCTVDEAHRCGKDRVLVQQITQDNQLPNDGWEDATPEGIPLITIQPCNLGSNTQDQRLAQIRVHLTGDNRQLPDALWIFPLGQAGFDPLYPSAKPESLTTPLSIPTLDGHVLALWGAGKERKLVITSFSQGGCPPSGGAFAPVPITAGSSDGRVMLFFYDPENQDNGDVSKAVAEKREAYSRIKVVTTINSGPTGSPPHPEARPASYAFSLASNSPLPAECYPTLAIHHDTLDEIDALTGHLVICRLNGSSWEPQLTYNQAGANVAVTPLTLTTAPDLVMETPEGGAKPTNVPPQYYQLFWMPRGD